MSRILDLFRMFAALAVILAALPTLRASSLTPWPYLQVYPPVDESDGSTPLYFALVLSSGGEYTSIGAVPGVQVALDYVNNQPDILPGYSLHYTLADSQVMRSTTFSGVEHSETIPHIQSELQYIYLKSSLVNITLQRIYGYFGYLSCMLLSTATTEQM